MEKNSSDKRKHDTKETICNMENSNVRESSKIENNKTEKSSKKEKQNSRKSSSKIENDKTEKSSKKEKQNSRSSNIENNKTEKSSKKEKQNSRKNSSKIENDKTEKSSNKEQQNSRKTNGNKEQQNSRKTNGNTEKQNSRKTVSKNTNTASNVQTEQENTQQPQKHWTQLNREYRLRRQGIYEESKSYREIPQKIDLPLNGCGFGDEHFLFEGPDGSPKYADINAPWDDFINWMEKVCKRYRKYKDTTRKGEYFLGQELIVHAAQRNVHRMYCYISLNWPDFRDGFLVQKDCPEIVIEFVRGIMANKMTEKQMWGTVDDRCPGGTVIVFDKEFMPKEGEDTGTIKFEYRPNYVQEQMEKMKRSNGLL